MINFTEITRKESHHQITEIKAYLNLIRTSQGKIVSEIINQEIQINNIRHLIK
jgi:hypothetical protein